MNSAWNLKDTHIMQTNDVQSGHVIVDFKVTFTPTVLLPYL